MTGNETCAVCGGALSSEAAQVTVVTPTENALPGAWVQLTGRGPSTVSRALTAKLTAAVPPAGATAGAGDASTVITGGVVSRTLMMIGAVAVLPKTSVAVQTSPVSPIGNVEPGAVARSGRPLVGSTGARSAGHAGDAEIPLPDPPTGGRARVGRALPRPLATAPYG